MVPDLVWQRGKPTVVTGDQVVVVDEDTAGRLASRSLPLPFVRIPASLAPG